MQPRSEGPQALRSFQINTNPRAQLYAYTDHAGNAVYHFNVLREHQELRIEAQAVVEITRLAPLPDALDMLEWERYNPYNLSDEHFDLLSLPIRLLLTHSPQIYNRKQSRKTRKAIRLARSRC